MMMSRLQPGEYVAYINWDTFDVLVSTRDGIYRVGKLFDQRLRDVITIGRMEEQLDEDGSLDDG